MKEINGVCNFGTQCPAQWDSRDQKYYIRYRHGILTIHDNVTFDVLAQRRVGSEYDGYLTTEEMAGLLPRLGFRVAGLSPAVGFRVAENGPHIDWHTRVMRLAYLPFEWTRSVWALSFAWWLRALLFPVPGWAR